MPTRIHVAPGSRDLIAGLLLDSGVRRTLAVIDPGIRETEWLREILSRMEASGIEAVAFDTVHANPRVRDAVLAARTALEYGCQGVLAIGGGSALDCGKAAAMLATNDPEQAANYAGRDRFPNAPLSMVAVPTTCGTGSEVTWVSVLSDPEAATKISIKGEAMFPNHAVVDAELLTTLPAHLVASTAMDALTHAIEATIGTAANPVSDALAEQAIDLIFRFLPRAVADVRGDSEAREAVMRASTLAGLSFGNADVGGVHCLSESLGGMFDVPHGLANAILLVPVLRAHDSAIHARLAELEHFVAPGVAASAAVSAQAFLGRIETLATAVGIPSFASLDISASEFDAVAASAEANGSNGSNPRPMSAADYRKILDGLIAA